MGKKPITSFQIFYNKSRDFFFIENPNCPALGKPVIDVCEFCFKCDNYLGILLGKKKIKLICLLACPQHPPQVNFKPLNKRELKKIWEKLQEKRNHSRRWKVSLNAIQHS